MDFRPVAVHPIKVVDLSHLTKKPTGKPFKPVAITEDELKELMNLAMPMPEPEIQELDEVEEPSLESLISEAMELMNLMAPPSVAPTKVMTLPMKRERATPVPLSGLNLNGVRAIPVKILL